VDGEGSTSNKLLRFKVEIRVPLLSKIRATMLVTSTTLFGPAATWVSGGSHPGPHWESGNARPRKLVDTVGVVVSASVANDGTSGSVAPDIAALRWR